jgi:hypothetical protein
MPSAQQCSRVLPRQSKAGFGGWLFHRDGTSPYPKSADVHATNQNATQATARVAPPSILRNDTPEYIPRVVSIRAGEVPAKSADVHATIQNATQATARVAPPSILRNDTPEYIPRVVSIRAGEGPADYYLQDSSARRPTLPTVTPAARDATVQPLPTAQVLQQSQTVDRQPRAVPRIAASVQIEPPSHDSVAQLTSPRPWLQSAQLTAEPWPMSPVPQPMSPVMHPMSPALHPMSPALHPMSPTPLPPVVPSPMVFSVPLAPPAAVMETHRPTTPARLHHRPPTQEGPIHTQAPQEIPWLNTTAISRPPAPMVPSHSMPPPTATNGQRVSPQGAPSAIPDVASAKHPKQRPAPGVYGDALPVPPPSRPVAPDLAAAFPIREDNVEAYHRYSTQEEHAHETRASRNIPDQWDRHGHNQESATRVVVSIVPSSERTPRSTKTSPKLHPRPVNQGTPPKYPLPPILPPTYQPQAPTNLDLPQAQETDQPGVYNVLPQNLNLSAYPATSIYPSSSSRTHVEASPAVNDLPVANAPSNNPSPKVKPGNPSPRSRSQVVAPPQQGPTPPVVMHVTNRTPSHETGSTTLLGQTPSSQGSMLLPVPMSPMSQHQVIVPRVGNYSGQQSAHIPAPVPDILGDRNTHATAQTLATPVARQTTARHYHSASAPTVPVSSLSQPPPVRSQTQPTLKAPTPLSPTPVRSYSTAQALGDPYATRYPVSGYPSTPGPNARQLRSTIPSPSQESELNTPSSLAISTKLPIVSDEPIAPVMSSQSYQEPKKKSGFFQGLFRSRSSAQKRHPHEIKMVDTGSRAQLPPIKLASSKTPVPLQYESDSKVGMAPSKLRKARTPAATHPPVSTSVSQVPMSQPQPPPTPMAPPPTPLARFEERRISTVPNAFASFRIVSSKRHRTMSGASAEAVDGTNAGVRPSVPLLDAANS